MIRHRADAGLMLAHYLYVYLLSDDLFGHRWGCAIGSRNGENDIEMTDIFERHSHATLY